MKRLLVVLLALCLLCPCVASCGTGENGGVRVVCTAFAPYDFVRQIVGEREEVEVILLADNGADPHSFQPTAEHFAAIHSADLFVYLGAQSEPWAASAAEQAAGSGVRVLCLQDTVQSQTCTEEHGHGHGHTEDEHLFLSPLYAQDLCAALCEELCETDPEGEEQYRSHLKAYGTELERLHVAYSQMRREAVRDTVLIADRFPFVHLMEAYEIKYYAAFPGCSAESEASFETVATLAECLREEELPAVLITETSDGALAQTVCDSAKRDVPVLILHSLQSLTAEEQAAGASYLSVMQENLEVLRKALGK